jgi:hypothetical protein
MVNPGSFQGTRKEFLLGEKAAYKAERHQSWCLFVLDVTKPHTTWCLLVFSAHDVLGEGFTLSLASFPHNKAVGPFIIYFISLNTFQT